MKAERARMGKPMKAGDEYVVLDTSKLTPVFVISPDPAKPGHWFINPKDSSKMDEWIDSGPGYSLTETLKAAIIRPVRKI